MWAAIFCAVSLGYPCLVSLSPNVVGTDPGGAACILSGLSSSISHIGVSGSLRSKDGPSWPIPISCLTLLHWTGTNLLGTGE